MAKRRSAVGKTSRKQRKVQRERSARAKQHGLPAKEPEKRSKASTGRSERDETTIPSMRKLKERAARARSDDIEAELGDRRASSAPTLRDRIAKIPQAAQLAIIAGVVLLVIFVASQFRSGGAGGEPVAPPAPSRTEPADELAAPVASVLEEATALPSVAPEPEPAPSTNSAKEEPTTAEASDSTAPAAALLPAPPAPVMLPTVTAPKPVAPVVPKKPAAPPAAVPEPAPATVPAPTPAPAAPQDNPY